MEKFNPTSDAPRWHGFVLVPCGVLAFALGVFSLYDHFWGGFFPLSFNPVFSVLIVGAGVAGTVSGLRRLFGV